MAAFVTNRLIGLRRRLSPMLQLILAVVFISSVSLLTGASEFPERECCDLPPLPDAGFDVRQQPTTPSSLSSHSTEMPPHSSEHPDTSNFLYPEFIPELSLDLGYPMPPPPLHPHHQHPSEGGNYVPTTTGTGIYRRPNITKSIHLYCASKQVKIGCKGRLEIRVLRLDTEIFIGYSVEPIRAHWMAKKRIDKKDHKYLNNKAARPLCRFLFK